jgi:hypothetical protein
MAQNVPALEQRDITVLTASLQVMSAVLLCRDHSPGTERQLNAPEKAVEWERRRLEEADARARLRERSG